MRAPMRRGRKSRLKNSPLSSCSLRPSMESGTTGYSPEGQVVEVIFAKNLSSHIAGCGQAPLSGELVALLAADVVLSDHLTKSLACYGHDSGMELSRPF